MTKAIDCAGCGRTHCTQTVGPDGRHQIRVTERMVMRCVDPARSLYEIQCPGCGTLTPVTLRLDADAPPRRPACRQGRRRRAAAPRH